MVSLHDDSLKTTLWLITTTKNKICFSNGIADFSAWHASKQ
jgi:hypothetical protein